MLRRNIRLFIWDFFINQKIQQVTIIVFELKKRNPTNSLRSKFREDTVYDGFANEQIHETNMKQPI